MTRRPLCMFCIVFAAGIFIMNLAGLPVIRGNPLPDDIQERIEKNPEAEVAGEAVRIRDTEYGTSLILKNAKLVENQKETVSVGNLKVYTRQPTVLKEGSFARLSGRLERIEGPSNPGEFDNQIYYSCDHIYYYLKKAVLIKQSHSYSFWKQGLSEARNQCKTIFSLYAREAAPFFDAILLGDKTGLDEEIKLRFQMAGIIHILAISGLHISILGIGLFSLLRKAGFTIPTGGIICLLIMITYGQLTGSGVSVMRSVTMFVLMIGARLTGRIYDLPTALGAAAILLLLDSPSYLGNVSFLLSFSAVTGTAVTGRIFVSAGERWIKAVFSENSRSSFGISRILPPFLTSLAVHLTTLPILLYFYGEISHAGIILNLLVLPTVALVLISALAVLVSGEIAWIITGGKTVPIVCLTAVPGRLGLQLYQALGDLTGRLGMKPWVGGRPGWQQILIYYTLLTAAVLLLRKGEDTGDKGDMLHLWPAVLLIAAGLWVIAPHRASDLKITCLDVGQGDGIVLKTPEGTAFLIDGGSSDKNRLGRNQLLPFLKSQGISRLEGVLISHTDMDHISGVVELMELLARRLSSVSIDTLYLPDWGKDPPKEWRDLEALAEDCGIEVQKMKKGDRLVSGNLILEALAPEKGAKGMDVNEECLVLQASYGSFSSLFTGDIGEETEKKLLGCLIDVDFLKVAHHGSGYSTCQDFVNKTRPEGAVISCSAVNRYGHPSPEVIRRLESSGCSLGLTMTDGAVTVLTNGSSWHMETMKERKTGNP